MRTPKHWTALQTEEANRTPIKYRPFCWHCRRSMVWAGCWMCPDRALLPIMSAQQKAS